MFKKAEVGLTALYLVLSAALLAAMGWHIHGALAGRAERMSVWDPRVPIAYRVSKLALALSVPLLALGVIYALSVVILYTTVVRPYAKALFYVTLCAWALLEACLCFSIGEQLLHGPWFRQLAFWGTVSLSLPIAASLSWLIARSLPYPPTEACVLLNAPVRGTWLAGHAGASQITNIHTTHPYAIDILKLGPDGRFVNGSDRVVNNWYGYGEPVYAPADGQIVEVVDGFPCRPIGDGDVANPGGNHVVIDIGNDKQVVLAHLAAGSVAVDEGAHVTSGALIGRVGNSGNSEAPHLHMHVQSASGTAVPFRFRSLQRKRWLFWMEVTNGYLIRNDWIREDA
ncbi:MAG: M23 family metallopeptidase [Anaerolineae bacterium]|nr:M23 family metallopeptidase [Anaerolineae bacterium]